MRIYTLTLDDKKKIKQKIKEALIKREEIIFAYLHGSFIEDRPFRDIDVAVYVDGNHDLTYELELEEELTRIVGFPVDVRTINNAPVTFRFKVIGGELLFTKDERVRCEFEERTLREYHDYEYYLKIYRREVLGVR
ncbi:nucleotidyltransferase domain-containing protein [Thermococcus sp.]|uniref:type VII toxin-antitoxin system MntA family adenylyltransferase antitoxin n=1 Tax=Thermococcus sp. TaxID=35749 RepID=UPI0019A7A5A8|nr:nucleotidyltransferase domain-containing protein [Thermococcus sp.]MBC7095442.1 nucleotidyltransferase domain-containing protein [Thermococcus sp.]